MTASEPWKDPEFNPLGNPLFDPQAQYRMAWARQMTDARAVPSDIPAEALGDEEVSRLLAEREELRKQLETKRKSGAVQRAIELLKKQNEALRRELAGEPQPKGTL